MIDPLSGFDWNVLYRDYDESCKGFKGGSTHLSRIEPGVTTDRDLYCHLASRFKASPRNLSMCDWEAMLYWKLYSTTGSLKQYFKNNPPASYSDQLQSLISSMPKFIDRSIDRIIDLLRHFDRPKLPGTKDPCRIAVRSTFLHFMYPDTVPIFDKMVLQAVGEFREGANQDLGLFREYVPHAWRMADQHAAAVQCINGEKVTETPIRLIDMALWVHRGKKERTRSLTVAARKKTKR